MQSVPLITQPLVRRLWDVSYTSFDTSSSSSSLTRSRLGPIACLHRVAMGTLLLSRQSWSVHLVRGQPGRRFHEGCGGRLTDSSTWRSMAWCAGIFSGNLATYPNMALRHLVINRLIPKYTYTGRGSVEWRRRDLGLQRCDRVAVERKFNTDWSAAKVPNSRLVCTSTKCELYATLSPSNFPVYRTSVH